MKAKFLGVLCVSAFLLIATKPFAQSFDVGLTAGVSSGTVKVSEIGSAFTNTIEGKNIVGFEGGLLGRLNLDPLYVKGMFLLAYKGGPSDFVNDDGTIRSSRFSIGRLQVPVLFGLKLIGPIRVEAGPVVNWIFHESHSEDESINVRKTGYGYRVGANVEFGIVNLGLAYQGLKNKSDGSSTATYSTPDELIFSLGILLNSSDDDE
jgi:hypothetical protein